MGNWNTSGEVLHEQKEGEETTALPHPPVQQRVVTLRQDLLHPPKMSQFLGLNEEVQQRVDNDSDNVDNEKIVKPKEKPLPFSGTKIPIEIIPLVRFEYFPALVSAELCRMFGNLCWEI